MLPNATVTIQPNITYNTITVSSPVLVVNMAILLDDSFLQLSENYFDLLPGETKVLQVLNNDLILI
jgi:hypothetical protein